MDGAFLESFSSDCPKCGGERIRPTVQWENLAAVAETTPDGRVVTTRAVVSLTRRYICDDCGGVWTETVPAETIYPTG
jgi:hypothetical protein